MPIAHLSQFTALIHSTCRPKQLQRLLADLWHLCPSQPVVVATEHDLVGHHQKVISVRLPAGHSASDGRNALLARVRTPFFLLLEDSFQFLRQTRIDRLLGPLLSESWDLVVCDVVCCRRSFLFRQRVEHPMLGTFRATD